MAAHGQFETAVAPSWLRPRMEVSKRAPLLKGKAVADLKTAELPVSPTSLRRIIGPGIVAARVGLGSGEFIFFPDIASQVGLVFVWAAVLGVVVQYFLNTEIERYTLTTGETLLTGFSRLGRPPAPTLGPGRSAHGVVIKLARIVVLPPL